MRQSRFSKTYNIFFYFYVVCSNNRLIKMGFTRYSDVLSLEQVKKNTWIVHKMGILQFISIYKKYKDISGYSLKWGDEVNVVVLYKVTF